MNSSLRSIRDLDPEAFHFIPLGIGWAFTRNHFNASLLLIHGGRTLLVDAPAPLRRLFAEAERKTGIALDLDILDGVLLTHLHADHTSGLEELAFWRMFFAPELPKPRLYVMDELVEDLWRRKLAAGLGKLASENESEIMSLNRYFDVVPFTAGQPVPRLPEGFAIETRPTTHMVPTVGLRASWNGASLGYSADTGFDPGFFDFANNCHLIVHETGVGKGHTPLEDLLSLPADVRRRLHLIHIPDDFDVEGSPIPVLEQGRLYRVGQD